MADRPLGISLVCVFFGLVGLGLFVGGLGLLGRLGQVELAEAPQSVRLFLTIVPFWAIFNGVLGMYAAVTLWGGSPRGRIAGLIGTGMWAAAELFIGIWAVTGPDLVRQATGGVGDNIVRILIAGILFYYLWTVGATYVETERTDASATQRHPLHP